MLKPYNVRVIPDAGDVVFVGADTIAKLSAETSKGRFVAAWGQRIVIWADQLFLNQHCSTTAVKSQASNVPVMALKYLAPRWTTLLGGVFCKVVDSEGVFARKMSLKSCILSLGL